MSLFKRPDTPHPRTDRLRHLERVEREAVRELVHQGAKAAIEADKATEKADEISQRLTQRSSGEAVILTAEQALKLIWDERGRKR